MKTVYLESTIISYLTARPSRDLIVAGNQCPLELEIYPVERRDKPLVYALNSKTCGLPRSTTHFTRVRPFASPQLPQHTSLAPTAPLILALVRLNRLTSIPSSLLYPLYHVHLFGYSNAKFDASIIDSFEWKGYPMRLLGRLSWMTVLATSLQIAAILLIALVAGSTFGIWQGYDPSGYSATTFVEMHQGAVRGLNVLLPAMALAAIAATVVLAILSRDRPSALRLYLVALSLMIAGGVITRFANQPINAEITKWTVGALPTNWTDFRNSWWHWHIVRTLVTIGATLAVVAAVFADRDTQSIQVKSGR